MHDLFDSEQNRNGCNDSSDNTILTTWYDGESLDEFLYFCLAHTLQAGKYLIGCKSLVAVVIANEDRAAKIKHGLVNASQIYTKSNDQLDLRMNNTLDRG